MKFTFDCREAAGFLSAVANPRRLLILRKLQSREWDVGTLAIEVELSQSALSQHLKILRDAGLVATKRVQQNIFYSTSSAAVERLLYTLDDLVAPRLIQLDSMVLAGRRVMVVEDDYDIAMEEAEKLEDAGATVIGPCASAEAALELLATNKPSSAILDLNLGTGLCFDLANRLREKRIPFVFVTGYDRDVVPEEFADVPFVQKPFQADVLLGSLRAALAA